MGPIEALVLSWYLLVMALLALYGLHRLELLTLVGRKRAPPSPPPLEDWPMVTVQLPVMNERYVVERLVRSVAALDYPPDRLEIQLLDDSDDDTTALGRALVEALDASGVRARLLHRRDRAGFKAGALKAGLSEAAGDFTFILDADFVAPRDFLRRLMPFFDDERVGLVQARWGHLNAAQSPLTRAQALMLDGHFTIEHAARQRSGRFFNFNGTAGVFRNAAIAAAGGWHDDTLTEDLDLSYRMQLAGYRAVYVDDVVVPAELPARIGALKSQQHRWAKGSLQTCRKLLPRIWRSAAPLATKIEATFHLTDNVAYLLLLQLSLLSLPALLVRTLHGRGIMLALDLAFVVAGTAAMALFYGVAAGRARGHRPARDIPLLMALGVGLAINNSLAVLGGLLGVRSGFVRTPKAGDRPGGGAALAGYRPRRDRSFPLELFLGGWMLLTIAYAIATGVWLSMPFLALLAAGYLWVGGLSVRERLAAA